MYEPNLDMEFTRKRNNHTLPNARVVSSVVHAVGEVEKEDARQFSLLVMQFGQFLDHDLTLTPQTPSCRGGCGAGEGGEDNVCCEQFLDYHANPNSFPNYTRRPECWPIPIKDDPYFGEEGPKCLEFRRSLKVECDVFLRMPEDELTEFNEVTHVIDLSSVYGSLQDKSSELRGFKKGLLKFNQFKDDMLPFELNFCPVSGSTGDEESAHPLRHPKQFNAGDIRANENPGLQSIHTLWVKEHNRLAKEMYKKFPEKNDEEIFQETRKYVIAEWQNIIYNEWLPLVIGEKYMESYGLFNIENSQYDAKEKPTIVQEFSTAAFRFGHGLIRSIVELHQIEGKITPTTKTAKPIQTENLDLSQQFFKTGIIQTRKIQELVMGMTAQGTKEFGPQMANAVRLQLFKPEDSIFGNDLGKPLHSICLSIEIIE